MKARLRSAWRDEDGLTTVEYALLLAFVAIAGILAWTTLGQKLDDSVTTSVSLLPQ